MKYNININQKVLSKYKELDIKDMAIFDYIQVMCSSNNEKIDKARYKKHTWINYERLIEDMPALRIKSRNSISARITKLSETGLITVKKNMVKGHRRVFVRLTTLSDSVFVESTERVLSDEKRVLSDEKRVLSDEKRVRESVQDYNTINNNTKNNSDETSPKSNSLIVNETIEVMKPLNELGYSMWFKNKTQRKAVEQLLKQYSKDDIVDMIKYIVNNRSETEPYTFPSVTTPLQLIQKHPNITRWQESKNKI